MKIVDVTLDKLKEYAQNNKIHNDYDIGKVADSLKEFGWKQPIVVDKNYEIIVGHGRYQAALSLGFKTAPCIIATDLTDVQIKAYRITDNQLNSLSTWNYEMLTKELKELSTMDIDIQLTGFEQSEVDSFISEVDLDIDDMFEDAQGSGEQAGAEDANTSNTYICEHCGKESNIK